MAGTVAPVGPPDDADLVRRGRQKHGVAGAALAGMMVALRDLVEGKPKPEAPIVEEAPDEPTDVDKDGINVSLGDASYVAPPLPPSKRRPTPRRRSGRRRRGA
jgi:hypothetical protein